jgi:hypothetical protein
MLEIPVHKVVGTTREDLTRMRLSSAVATTCLLNRRSQQFRPLRASVSSAFSAVKSVALCHLTKIVPCICGCSEQKYLYVPGFAIVVLNR